MAFTDMDAEQTIQTTNDDVEVNVRRVVSCSNMDVKIDDIL